MPRDQEKDFDKYRALSSAAVVAFVLGLVSLIALLFASMLVIPAAGLILGTLAIRKIRRYPNELTGIPLAFLGAVMSGLLLVSGSVLHAVVYVTEVPTGYERISFFQLRSEKRSRDIPPSSVKELDGKRVFVKGYVHPSVDGLGPVNEFVLVGDMKTCCFGGQPRLTEMINVMLSDRLRVAFSYKKRKLGGILRVDEAMKPQSGLQGGYYVLHADFLQ